MDGRGRSLRATASSTSPATWDPLVRGREQNQRDADRRGVGRVLRLTPVRHIIDVPVRGMQDHESTTISGERYAMTRRRCCLGLLAAFGAAAFTGCATDSSRPTLVSTTRERELGQTAANELEQTAGLVQDAALVDYVGELGRRLVAQVATQPNALYTFRVTDEAEPNAYALPGGFVYGTRGILALANSEDELAGVIGHEIGHVVARHSVRRLEASTPFSLLFGVP